MAAPVEFKVVAGTAGAGAGFVVSQFVLWLLGCWAWGASWTAGKAVDAVTAVPKPAGDMIALTVTVVGAYVFGWLAPHTHRPLEPAPVVADPPPQPAQLMLPELGLDDLLHTEPLPDPRGV